MRLTNDNIIELIRNPKNANNIHKARELQNDVELHFTGDGYKSLITQLIGKESAQDYSNKRELGEPITKPITDDIFKHLTMFMNRGNITRYYDFGKSLSEQLEFNATLNAIYNNNSIDKYIKEYYLHALFYKFNDFVILTRPAINGNKLIVNNKETESNITHYIINISISKVKDYDKTGNKVEYLIYEYSRTDKDIVYRVIDDVRDVLFIERGGTIFPKTKENGEIDELTHNVIPVRQVGSIYYDIANNNVCKSVIDSAVPLLRRYIKFDAINVLTEVNTSYSLPWSIGGKCKHCDGEGVTYSVDGEKTTCNHCNGTGYAGRHRPGEMMVIPYKIMDTERPLITAPAGIIEGSIDTPEFQSKRQKERLDEIYRITLGTTPFLQMQKTATEIDYNTKPLEARNATIAEMCEEFEYWVSSVIGSEYKSYKGSSINYNKKLNIKNENTLIQEITNAKQTGVSNMYVYSLVEEMVYSKYSHDNNELARQLKYIELEPYAGYKVEEVQGISDLERYMKVNIVALIKEIEKIKPIVNVTKEEFIIFAETKYKLIKQIENETE